MEDCQTDLILRVEGWFNDSIKGIYIYTNICTVVAAQTGSMPTVNMTCAQAPICLGPVWVPSLIADYPRCRTFNSGSEFCVAASPVADFDCLGYISSV